MAETTGSASIDIEASPEVVWNLLTDFERIGELSPECYKIEWEGDSEALEVGATFRGYNKAGGNEWDAGCEVVAAEPGKEWAFKVPGPPEIGDTIWRYEIEPKGAGCTVTETFDSPLLATERFQKIDRHNLLIGNIAKTLENLRQVAEA